MEGNNLLEVPESIGGLSGLKYLYLKGNNLVQVPESIGGLSCLEYLFLKGNNFTSLPGSLSRLSSLRYLDVNGCKKLEVLLELPPSLRYLHASDCTSLREVLGSSKDSLRKSGEEAGGSEHDEGEGVYVVYADIFTKGLPTALFLEFCSSLNVRRSPAHTEGEY
ncbi:NB-ARC domains-containing protein [Tanacetum coccineum]